MKGHTHTFSIIDPRYCYFGIMEEVQEEYDTWFDFKTIYTHDLNKKLKCAIQVLNKKDCKKNKEVVTAAEQMNFKIDQIEARINKLKKTFEQYEDVINIEREPDRR